MKLISFIVLLLALNSCRNDVKFNSDGWKKAGGINIMVDTRTNMVNDLVASKILLFKTESEIIELIGQPSVLHEKESDSINYFAIQEIYSWGDIDPEEMTYLKIIFNMKGKSKAVELFSTK